MILLLRLNTGYEKINKNKIKTFIKSFLKKFLNNFLLKKFNLSLVNNSIKDNFELDSYIISEKIIKLRNEKILFI